MDSSFVTSAKKSRSPQNVDAKLGCWTLERLRFALTLAGLERTERQQLEIRPQERRILAKKANIGHSVEMAEMELARPPFENASTLKATSQGMRQPNPGQVSFVVTVTKTKAVGVRPKRQTLGAAVRLKTRLQSQLRRRLRCHQPPVGSPQLRAVVFGQAG